MQVRNSPVLPLVISFIAVLFLNFSSVLAHGTVTSPPSRVWICYQEGPESPDSPACATSVADFGTQHLYDWNAIRQGDANENHTAVVPNGTLASGGDPAKYGGLDQLRSDWVTTTVSPGPFTVTWTNSAPHATEYYQVYITNADWTPDQPLRWDNITLLVETPFSLAESSVDIDVVLPPRTGHHVIYSVWQRADSPEAFYSASDVFFEGGEEEEQEEEEEEEEIDLKVSILGNLDIADDITVNSETYLPTLANGSTQNLTIDGSGRVTTSAVGLEIIDKATKKINDVYVFNRYDFSISKQKGGAWIASKGLHFEQGSRIKEVQALLLDNGLKTGSKGVSPSVKVYRQSKTSKSDTPDLIFELEGADTKADSFESFSSNTLVRKGAESIDNDKFIYYVEVKLCQKCDFTELRFLSF